MPAPTASDVPGVYDVIIDGQGYIFSNTVDQSLPFRVQRAGYSHTATFVDRTNTGVAYGDDQQAFWMTAAPNDWSLGEGQRFFKAADADSKRSYFSGSGIDISTPGQVSLRAKTTSISFAAAVSALMGGPNSPSLYAASATNLYVVDPSGSITDQGAHGLGVTPAKFGIASDGFVYVTGPGGSVRKSAPAWSTFSATGCDSLAFLNNALYGFDLTNTKLIKYDTAGTASDVFPWKRADGTADGSMSAPRMRPFGGSLAILFGAGLYGTSELWTYNGTATAIAAALPRNFYAADFDVSIGSIYISGAYTKSAAGSASNILARPAVFEYTADGTLALIWRADAYYATSFTTASSGPLPSITSFDGGVVWNDDSRGVLLYYDIAEGAVSSIGSYTVAGNTPLVAAAQRHLLHTRNQTTGYYYPDTSAVVTSGTVTSSLFDFDSSLAKLFRGIKVDFSAATDGDGGSVDIAYRVSDLDGSYTTLQTGATSGTEYNPSGVSGHSISVKVTLNKGTSTAGPILKRVYVRAAPVKTAYRLDEMVLDLSGRNGKNPVRLRNDRDQTLDGMQMAANLRSAITSASPVSVTDRFGTYTAILEPDQCEIIELRPEEFLARISVREV